MAPIKVLLRITGTTAGMEVFCRTRPDLAGDVAEHRPMKVYPAEPDGSMSVVVTLLVRGDRVTDLIYSLAELSGITSVKKVLAREESVRLERDDDGIGYFASVVVAIDGDRARLLLGRTWFPDQLSAYQTAGDYLAMPDRDVLALPYERC